MERRMGLWWDPLFPLWCQADSFALGPVVGSTKPEFELGLKNKNKQKTPWCHSFFINKGEIIVFIVQSSWEHHVNVGERA